MNWAKSREPRDQLVLFPTRWAVIDAQNDKQAFPVTDHHDPSLEMPEWEITGSNEGLFLSGKSLML